MTTQTATGAWKESTIWLVTAAVLFVWDSLCLGIEKTLFNSTHILAPSGLMLALVLLLPLLILMFARTAWWRKQVDTDIRSAIFFAVMLVAVTAYAVGHFSALVFPPSLGGIS